MDDSDEAQEKAGGSNANLWIGLGMLVFALWSRLRPIVVLAPRTGDGAAAPPAH